MSKTAIGLVEYAKAQLVRPYWYGSFGKAGSKEFYEQKKNQYPNQYTWDGRSQRYDYNLKRKTF